MGRRFFQNLLLLTILFSLASCGGSAGSGSSGLLPSGANGSEGELPASPPTDEAPEENNPPPTETVNAAPITGDDFVTIEEDTALTAFNVLVNDRDPEGQALSVTSASTLIGTVVIDTTGLIRFEPPENFNGEALVKVRVSDGETSSVSDLLITVTPANDFPVSRDDYFEVVEDSSATALDVLQNDVDVDFHDLTLVDVSATVGEVSIEGNEVSYTPASGFTGLDLLTYEVVDSEGASVTAVVSIDVIPRAGHSLSLEWDNPIERIDGAAIAESEIAAYTIEYRNIQTESSVLLEVDRIGVEHSALADGTTRVSYLLAGLPSGYFEFIIKAVDIDGQTSLALRSKAVRIGS